MNDLFTELGFDVDTPNRWDAERADDFDSVLDDDEEPEEFYEDEDGEPLY